MQDDLRGLKTSLIVAHPGHECRVYAWIKRLRPEITVLTDGSGRCNPPRIGTTQKIIEQLGASSATIFGEISDLKLYEFVAAQNHSYFAELTERLANSLIDARCECVIGDSAEGEIMAHDLFREVRRAAVQIAEASLGYKLMHYEFALDSHPLAFPPQSADAVQRIELTEDEFDRKLQTAKSYDEISEFVCAAIEMYGVEAFTLESIFPFTDQSLLTDSETCTWEQHGQQQVEKGSYSIAITRGQHLVPIASRLASLSPSAIT